MACNSTQKNLFKFSPISSSFFIITAKKWHITSQKFQINYYKENYKYKVLCVMIAQSFLIICVSGMCIKQNNYFHK